VRPTNPPSSGRAIFSWVPPDPIRRSAVGGCPLPPPQRRDLVDEARKLRDLQPELPAADSDQWQARPAWIDRRRSAVSAVRPGSASASFWTLTGGPPAHGSPPCSPPHGLFTDRRPERDATAHGYRKTLVLKSGFAARGIELLQWIGRCCCNHPRMAPTAAASALLAPR
jgi:hypothetical protein